MGGKKKGKKGKKGKKKKGGGIADDATTEEKNFILQAEKEALEQKLIMTLQQANSSKRMEQEKRAREAKLNEAMEMDQKRTHDIIADMTRQYKSTEDELNQQLSRLDQREDTNAEIIKDLKAQYEAINTEKENQHKAKTEELNQLHAYINTMNQNFSSMLKSTLTKMKDRINQANRTWEQENDTKMLEKFKEIVDNGNTNI